MIDARRGKDLLGETGIDMEKGGTNGVEKNAEGMIRDQSAVQKGVFYFYFFMTGLIKVAYANLDFFCRLTDSILPCLHLYFNFIGISESMFL